MEKPNKMDEERARIQSTMDQAQLLQIIATILVDIKELLAMTSLLYTKRVQEDSHGD